MGTGHTQGCHRCGGYPGHKLRNRAYLVRCRDCGTYTCNEHTLPVLGGCPKCKSGKLTKVLTQADVRNTEKGGAVDQSQILDGGGFDGGGASNTPTHFGGGLQQGVKPTLAPTLERDASKVPAAQGIDTTLLIEKKERETHTEKLAEITKEIHKPLADTLQGGKYDSLDDLFEDNDIRIGKVNNTIQTGMHSSSGQGEGEETQNEEQNEEVEDEGFEDENLDEKFEQVDWYARLDLNTPPIRFLKEVANAKQAVVKLDEATFMDAFWEHTGTFTKAQLETYLEYIPQREEHFSMGVLGMLLAQKGFEELVAHTPSNIFYAAGFKVPNMPVSNIEKNIFLLKKNIVLNNKIIALGEVGIDLHYAPYTQEQQQQALLKQLCLLGAKGFPVYLSQKKAVKPLAEVLKSYTQAYSKKEAGLRIVYTGLIDTEETLELIKTYDMHVALRPELTYASNAQALAYVKEVSPVRWLIAGGGALSTPVGAPKAQNTPNLILDILAPFFSSSLERGHPEELLGLCLGNWARFLFSTPLKRENELLKEDLWAEFR